MTRILTVLYFERSPARRNKGLQLKRNDQTTKQVVVEVARTVVVLKGNSCKGDGGWKIGDEIELKIKSTSVFRKPSCAGQEVQNSVTDSMLTRPGRMYRRPSPGGLQQRWRCVDPKVSQHPNRTSFFQPHFPVSNTVPLRSTSFPKGSISLMPSKCLVVIPILMFCSVAATVLVVFQTKPNHERLCKRANSLVASLKNEMGPSPCVRSVYEKNVNAHDSERNVGLKQRLRSTARCKVGQEEQKEKRSERCGG